MKKTVDKLKSNIMNRNQGNNYDLKYMNLETSNEMIQLTYQFLGIYHYKLKGFWFVICH